MPPTLVDPLHFFDRVGTSNLYRCKCARRDPRGFVRGPTTPYTPCDQLVVLPHGDQDYALRHLKSRQHVKRLVRVATTVKDDLTMFFEEDEAARREQQQQAAMQSGASDWATLAHSSTSKPILAAGVCINPLTFNKKYRPPRQACFHHYSDGGAIAAGTGGVSGCNKGQDCSYSHNTEKLRHTDCHAFLTASCTIGDLYCPMVHSKEKRATVLCSFGKGCLHWKRNKCVRYHPPDTTVDAEGNVVKLVDRMTSDLEQACFHHYSNGPTGARSQCTKGDACPFSHNTAQLQKSHCQSFLNGRCTLGNNCPMLHSLVRKALTPCRMGRECEMWRFNNCTRTHAHVYTPAKRVWEQMTEEQRAEYNRCHKPSGLKVRAYAPGEEDADDANAAEDEDGGNGGTAAGDADMQFDLNLDLFMNDTVGSGWMKDRNSSGQSSYSVVGGAYGLGAGGGVHTGGDGLGAPVMYSPYDAVPPPQQLPTAVGAVAASGAYGSVGGYDNHAYGGYAYGGVPSSSTASHAHAHAAVDPSRGAALGHKRPREGDASNGGVGSGSSIAFSPYDPVPAATAASSGINSAAASAYAAGSASAYPAYPASAYGNGGGAVDDRYGGGGYGGTSDRYGGGGGGSRYEPTAASSAPSSSYGAGRYAGIAAAEAPSSSAPSYAGGGAYPYPSSSSVASASAPLVSSSSATSSGRRIGMSIGEMFGAVANTSDASGSAAVASAASPYAASYPYPASAAGGGGLMSINADRYASAGGSGSGGDRRRDDKPRDDRRRDDKPRDDRRRDDRKGGDISHSSRR